MTFARTLLLALTLAALAAPVRADDEAARLAKALALEPGSVVADIGAGAGELAFALAQTVGPSGRVYATELDSDRLEELREKAASVSNVTVVEAQVTATGLPDDCCDAIYMRDVYHHLTDPAALNRDVARSLRPGGTFVVIDFRPGGLLRLFKVEGVSESRKGHGIAPADAERELGEAGFERVKLVDPWLDRLIGLDLWALFLRERASQSGSSAPPGSP